jgi:hypothetical protein
MINKENMEILNGQFQRIFTLPVTRLTFRELQNTIATALNDDPEGTHSLTEALLTNNLPDDPILKSFFKEYCIPFRVAKQIQDHGEALSMLSTDIGTQGENFIFQVSIRKMDGGEFRFIADANTFLQIAEHIISRLSSTASTLAGKGVISELKPRLASLEKDINQLIK